MSETALLADIAARGYAHPDVLVTTEWVAQNLKNPNVRIVESNEDSLRSIPPSTSRARWR